MTPQEAVAYVEGLELFGMRFGLERMRRVLAALGDPHRAYPCVHVVGTNGKTSTTCMTAAVLSAHGMRCGARRRPADNAELYIHRTGGRSCVRQTVFAVWSGELYGVCII